MIVVPFVKRRWNSCELHDGQYGQLIIQELHGESYILEETQHFLRVLALPDWHLISGEDTHCTPCSQG